MRYSRFSKNELLDTLIYQTRFLTSRQRSFVRLIYKNLPPTVYSHTYEVTEQLVLLSLADGKKLIHFYYDILAIHFSVPVSVFKVEKAHYLRLTKDRERGHRFGKLMTKQSFLDSISVLKAEKKDHLIGLAYALLASGARGVDLTRVNKISFETDRTATALVPFDKTSTSFKTIEFDFTCFDDSWVTDSYNRVSMVNWLRHSKVSKNDLKQLRISCFFRPHELRASKAILLILKGVSKAEVMRRVGWKSECSLFRYIKSDFNMIAQKKSYEQVELLINEE